MEALTSLLPMLNTATKIGGTGYNLYNQFENQQYQNKLRSYAMDPAKMNAYAQQFTQPLNAGLTAGVANQAQGYLAQRGLSESPQISEQVEAQAIAPYIQQNQQQGYQDALQALGLGGGAINPATQKQNDQSDLAKMFAGFGGPQMAPVGLENPTPQSVDYSYLNEPDYGMQNFYQTNYAGQ